MKKLILLIAGLTFLTFNNQAQTVTDIEGNVYNTVMIGTQVWMQENLKTTKYNDGTDIAYPGANNTTWQNNLSGAYAWYNNDSVTYGNTYGALYRWYAISPASNGGRNICPAGWHVPDHSEWTALERAICSSASCTTDFPFNLTTTGNRGTDEGGKLKENGSTHWWSVNLGATNSSGFTALPGGYRLASGSYSGMESAGYWWSSTTDNSFTYNAWLRDLYYGSSTSERITFRKDCGLAVRCVCDSLITQINENIMEQNIQIYPNPATDVLTIDCGRSQHIKIQLTNIMGVVVYQAESINNKHEIDLSALSPGIYIISISGNDWTEQKKIIKE